MSGKTQERPSKEQLIESIRRVRQELNTLESMVLDYVHEKDTSDGLLLRLNQRIANEFKVPPRWMTARVRLMVAVDARALRNWAFERLTGMSPNAISHLLERDHGTIYNSMRRAQELMLNPRNAHLKQRMELIVDEFTHHTPATPTP